MRLRLALLTAVVLGPALLAILLLRSGASRDAEPAVAPPKEEASAPGMVSTADHWLGGALDPGPLSKVHASLSGVSDCLDCHGTASQVIDARCVACHLEIGARADRKIGWHGTFDQPCRTCHAEHLGADAKLIDLDRKAFQHKLTRFPLRGAHLGAGCDACHRLIPLEGGKKVVHYQGVPSAACTGCHVDPHAGGARARENLGPIRQVALDAAAPVQGPRLADHPIAGRDCASCHRENGFGASQLRRGRFDHAADTLFALRGAHASVACESCHTEKRRKEERRAGLAPGTAADPDCATCHDDPHRGAMKAADGCRTCHSETGWHKGFDHDKDTSFKLDGLHARLDCAACHSDQRFRTAGRECADCHGDAAALLAGRFGDARGEVDPHAEKVACADCHRPTVAANRPAALAKRCAECHTPEYAGLLSTWTAKLDALAGASALDPERAEPLRRSGPHNFALARDLLGTRAH
ncbi:MAG: cytochrome c3 family protein [bacterium]